MSRPIIEVRNLSKRYRLGAIGATSIREEASRLWDRMRGVPHPDAKEFWALRDVSFDVQPGEVVGVIGRNGAGKSTLLKILSRITEPTSGTAKLRGRVASLLEVGTGFHPELTGRENVFLNGAILGMTRAEVRKKFDEIVAFAEVDRFIDTPVKRYSSGMYVRLAFAVAAHLEPEILIVDEVLAVGDAQFQGKCLGKIKDVASGQGRTVIFVSHTMSAVASFCDRALFLRGGSVAFEGATGEAIGRYLSLNQNGSGQSALLAINSAEAESPVTLEELTLNGGLPIISRNQFEATLQFTVHRPIAALGFGLGLCGMDGRRIITLESDYANDYFRLERVGTMSVRLVLPVLDLSPGRYRVDVGAFAGNHVAFHYAPDCMNVEIHPAPETPAHLLHSTNDYRPASTWKLVNPESGTS